MSVVYAAALKNTRMTDVLNAIGATGKLVIMTSGSVVLATLPLANPAGTVANGVLTLSAAGVSAAASAAGTAALAKITDGTNDQVTGLTVGTSGTDIIINNASISNGQTVTMTSGSITHG